MNILAIIGIIIAILGIILIILVNQYNKFQWTNVLVDKGETNLDLAFTKKHDILMRYLDILKDNKINIPDEEYDKYNTLNTKQSITKVNKEIEELTNYISKIMDDNEKLLKKEAIVNINKELNEVNVIINGGKKYYNDNLVLYNHLCNAFPSNLIAKLNKYKEKDFLDGEMKDELKILDGEEE
jgi:hypothetical protein